MLAINCLKFIFGYLYVSPSTFPKIQQKLGGQLEIRLIYVHFISEWFVIHVYCGIEKYVNYISHRNLPAIS